MKLQAIPEFGPGDGIWYIRRDDRPEPVHFAQISMIDGNVVHVLDKIIGGTKIGKTNMFKSKHEAYKALHKLNNTHELAELKRTAFDLQTNAKIGEPVFVLPEDYMFRFRANEPVDIVEAKLIDVLYSCPIARNGDQIYNSANGWMIVNQDELDTLLCSDMGCITDRIKELEEDVLELKELIDKLEIARCDTLGIMAKA